MSFATCMPEVTIESTAARGKAAESSLYFIPLFLSPAFLMPMILRKECPREVNRSMGHGTELYCHTHVPCVSS